MTIDIKALRALHDVARDVAATTSKNRHLALHDLADKLIWTGTDDPMKGDLPALLDAYEERDRLRDWQEAVADGLGYLNRAEGQGGYEVAKPEVIANTYNRICAERDAICKAHNEVIDERDRLQGIVDDISSETGHCLLLDDEEHEAPALPDWVRDIVKERDRLRAKLAALISDTEEAIEDWGEDCEGNTSWDGFAAAKEALAAAKETP